MAQATSSHGPGLFNTSTSLSNQPTQIIAPATSQVELEERISLFWTIFVLDRYASLICGTSPSLRDETIWTSWPRDPSEWEMVRGSSFFFGFFGLRLLFYFFMLICARICKSPDDDPCADHRCAFLLEYFLPSPPPHPLLLILQSRAEMQHTMLSPTPETLFPVLDYSSSGSADSSRTPIPRNDLSFRAMSAFLLQRSTHVAKAAAPSANQQASTLSFYYLFSFASCSPVP